jgi:short-subunit dehydrogenase involved in D-alanine esterification of teichoic acids
MNGVAKLTFLSLNLGSKKSVHEFVEQFKKSFDKLNLLVLNASIITEAKETT